MGEKAISGSWDDWARTALWSHVVFRKILVHIRIVEDKLYVDVYITLHSTSLVFDLQLENHFQRNNHFNVGLCSEVDLKHTVFPRINAFIL